MKRLFALDLPAFMLAVGLALLGFQRPAAAETLQVGRPAPTLSYQLIDGKTLTSNELRGHPYMLWLVATWCSSCRGGTVVVAQHSGELRSRGVRVVEVEVANDLGYPGPPLDAFRKAVGMAAASPNWYWGELTTAQTQLLDPHAYPDIYYLIDARGRIVAIDGAPGATWSKIASFAAEPNRRFLGNDNRLHAS